MECLFPGSSSIPRRFDIATVELKSGATTTVAGTTTAISPDGTKTLHSHAPPTAA
jgi:hypothetical protein